MSVLILKFEGKPSVVCLCRNIIAERQTNQPSFPSQVFDSSIMVAQLSRSVQAAQKSLGKFDEILCKTGCLAKFQDWHAGCVPTEKIN
jgi:hypothetical protein